MKAWKYVKLRDRTEGLSMEERANRLRISYRRFIFQEESKSSLEENLEVRI